MRKLYRLLLTALLTPVASSLSAQTASSPAHTVYLLGNTATAALPTAHLQALRRQLEQQTGPFTVVHLGDIVGNEGLGSKKDTTQTELLARADALIGLVKGLPNGKIYFVPGDKDWANS